MLSRGHRHWQSSDGLPASSYGLRNIHPVETWQSIAKKQADNLQRLFRLRQAKAVIGHDYAESRLTSLQPFAACLATKGWGGVKAEEA